MKKIENSFVVSGYVSNDAQIRSFETASVARFSIAVSRSEKKGEETVYTSAFLPVEAWRKNEAADSFDRIQIERWLRPPFFYALSRIILAYTQFSYSHHPIKVPSVFLPCLALITLLSGSQTAKSRSRKAPISRHVPCPIRS